VVAQSVLVDRGDHPAHVGDRIEAGGLAPLVPLRPRRGLRQMVPAAAAGLDGEGRPLVVVTMVGIDLDVVTEAADYRVRHDPDAELVIAMPERDLGLSTTGLSRLASARALALEGPWTTAGY
ncbi:MAG: hypothetical protein AAFN30_00830, partial [Actinomycetota bacterium]